MSMQNPGHLTKNSTASTHTCTDIATLYKFQWSARGATELLAEKHHGAKRNREHAVASFWVDNACACIMPAFIGDNNVFVASPGQNATGQNATGKALLGQNATNE